MSDPSIDGETTQRLVAVGIRLAAAIEGLTAAGREAQAAGIAEIQAHAQAQVEKACAEYNQLSEESRSVIEMLRQRNQELTDQLRSATTQIAELSAALLAYERDAGARALGDDLDGVLTRLLNAVQRDTYFREAVTIYPNAKGHKRLVGFEVSVESGAGRVDVRSATLHGALVLLEEACAEQCAKTAREATERAARFAPAPIEGGAVG